MLKHNVEFWGKYSSPDYPTVLSLEHYHIVKDRDSSDFYIQNNKVSTLMDKKQHNIRGFNKQNNRKPIDTFVKCNDSRFDPI